MKKKSIVVLATLLILALGASAAMAGGWGGCGMWGGGYGPNTYATATPGQYNCPMRGTPGNYYCPMTGNGYCSMVAAPGSYYQTNTPAQNNYTPSGGYNTATGWGCW